MSDMTDDEPRASDDARTTEAASPADDSSDVSKQPTAPASDAAPWTPATDAGVPGADMDPSPKRPARGGDAPLKRRPPASAKSSPTKPGPTAGQDDAETFEGERIAKAMARAGIASRRDAEAMIEAGRVTVNGERLTSPALNVTDADAILIDGEPLPARERTRLWIFHKPRGVVTTARDPEGRPTVFQALPDDLPRVVAIGRLDINTEGLLLLTNDGGLAKVVAHPDTGWLRRYRVRAFGDITQPELDKLRKGVTIDGMEYGPIEASLDRATGDNVWLTLGLREGKNREVKRILEHLGLSVNRLIRLSFGPFQLGDLEVGLVEEIRTKVLKEQLGDNLAAQAGVDFESPVREPIAPFGKQKKPATSDQGSRPKDGPRPARSASAARGASTGFGDRPGREPSRPATPARVPTGGVGAGARRSVWRADEGDEGAAHGARAPRRGADPRTAREAAAERGRERVGAIRTGDRRVLVERLQPAPEPAPVEPHRRVRFRSQDDARPSRSEVRPRPQGNERPPPREFEDRGERRGPPRDRPQGGERQGGFRDEQRARSFEGGRGRTDGGAGRSERPGGFRDDRPGGVRNDRPGGERGGFRADGDRSGAARSDRPGGGFKAGGDRAGGFKPSGFKPGGERSGPGGRWERPGGGGFKAGGFKPGGERSGPGARSDRPGGGFKAGGKPGGFKAGGGFKGGAKPGGRPGGGFGGKPSGGRPPRGAK